MLPSLGSNDEVAIKCLVVLDTNAPVFPHSNFTIVRIGNNNKWRHRYQQLIQHDAWCAIGVVFNEESVNMMLNFLRPIDRHLILAFTKENPIDVAKISVSRPLLWAKLHQTKILTEVI